MARVPDPAGRQRFAQRQRLRFARQQVELFEALQERFERTPARAVPNRFPRRLETPSARCENRNFSKADKILVLSFDRRDDIQQRVIRASSSLS